MTPWPSSRPSEARARDPYAAASRFGALADAFCSNAVRWLWVPAFAGTTQGADDSLAVVPAQANGVRACAQLGSLRAQRRRLEKSARSWLLCFTKPCCQIVARMSEAISGNERDTDPDLASLIRATKPGTR